MLAWRYPLGTIQTMWITWCSVTWTHLSCPVQLWSCWNHHITCELPGCLLKFLLFISKICGTTNTSSEGTGKHEVEGLPKLSPPATFDTGLVAAVENGLSKVDAYSIKGHTLITKSIVTINTIAIYACALKFQLTKAIPQRRLVKENITDRPR